MVISGYDNMDGLYGVSSAAAQGQKLSGQDAVQAAKAGKTEEISKAELKSLKRSGAVECATCANRKYKDGSDEGDVSFKTPGHIAPSQSAGRVMAHEQEHVANAVEKAAKKNASFMSANVTLKTAICPECGRSYVAGGTTHTMIKYSKDKYSSNRKSLDYQALAGANIDEAV